MRRKLFFTLILCSLLLVLSNCPTTILFAEENVPSKTTIDNTSSLIQIEDIDLSIYDYMSTYANEFLFSSITDNKLLKYDTTCNIFDKKGRLDGYIFSPKIIKKVSANRIIVYDDVNRIQVFDNDFKYIKTYNTTEDFPLGEVVSMTSDYEGNTFILDKTNNCILEIKIEEIKTDEIGYINTLFVFTEDQQITEESRICVNANGDLIAISNIDNKTEILNNNGLVVQTIYEDGISDVLFDCQNNLYLTKKSDTTTTILKYDNIDYSFQDEKAINSIYKTIQIDVESGKFYYLSDSLYEYAPTDFSENAGDQSAPANISDTLLRDESLTFAFTRSPTQLYKTPVSFSSSITIRENTEVIILSESTAQNQNMSYVLTNIDGAEKTGYVEKNMLSIINSPQSSIEFKTICRNVKVLAYPTVNSGIGENIDKESTIILVLGNADNWTDYTGADYYTVSINNKIGYINQEYLTECDQFESININKATLENNSTQFIAYLLVISSLIILVIFICIIISKKHRNKEYNPK